MTTSALPAKRRSKHAPQLREQAVYLARTGWGGATKISKLLSRRHDTDLPVDTVSDWIRPYRADLDPLADWQPTAATA